MIHTSYILSSQRTDLVEMDSETKEECVVLEETVKLLNVSVGASKRASHLIAKFFMKV